MSDRFFLDTNTLVYLLEGWSVTSSTSLTSAQIEANRKADITLDLIQNRFLILGVQVFNELCNVARKRKFDWQKTKMMLVVLESLCHELVPLSLQVHKRGLQLHEKHRLQLYDALMLAAALEAGCTTFYSEDMQDGLVVDGAMIIRNPYKTP